MVKFVFLFADVEEFFQQCDPGMVIFGLRLCNFWLGFLWCFICWFDVTVLGFFSGMDSILLILCGESVLWS